MTRGATARLFVALDLPSDVRARLAAWARSASTSLRAASRAAAPARTLEAPSIHTGRAAAGRRPAERLRLLEPDTLHLTLCFLGDRPVEETESIGDALAAACAEARPVGELTLGAPLWLPPRRPRALAVELHDDPHRTLEALHDTLATALAVVGDRSNSAQRPGRRRFRPHVTVARLRPGDAPRERGLPATPPLSFAPRSVTLYRSWLTPTEAVYEELATHALASRG
jgi:2'-5' RNA ligase